MKLKKTKIKHFDKIYKNIESHWKCPKCKTEFIIYGFDENIIRYKCSRCDQVVEFI